MANNPEVSAVVAMVFDEIPDIEEGVLKVVWSPACSHGFNICPYFSATLYEFPVSNTPWSYNSINGPDQFIDGLVNIVEIDGIEAALSTDWIVGFANCCHSDYKNGDNQVRLHNGLKHQIKWRFNISAVIFWKVCISEMIDCQFLIKHSITSELKFLRRSTQTNKTTNHTLLKFHKNNRVQDAFNKEISNLKNL